MDICMLAAALRPAPIAESAAVSWSALAWALATLWW